MNKLEERTDGKYIINKIAFKPIAEFKPETIEMAFNFSYDMSFGRSGEHRDHRSGGTYKRKLGEIFANTFQGKLSEFAIYNTLYKEFPQMRMPDLDTWDLGKWDDTDFEINKYFLSVKSTKAFGNLLLLETKDWNENGEYIPNLAIDGAHSLYDFFILVRISPYCEDILKQHKMLFSNEVDKENLKDILINQKWTYDIPGFVSHKDIREVITNKHIIKQGEMLNGKTRMDAENYYIQTGDMRKIEELIKLLKISKK